MRSKLIYCSSHIFSFYRSKHTNSDSNIHSFHYDFFSQTLKISLKKKKLYKALCHMTIQLKGTSRARFCILHNIWKLHDNRAYTGYRQSKLYINMKDMVLARERTALSWSCLTSVSPVIMEFPYVMQNTESSPAGPLKYAVLDFAFWKTPWVGQGQFLSCKVWKPCRKKLDLKRSP